MPTGCAATSPTSCRCALGSACASRAGRRGGDVGDRPGGVACVNGQVVVPAGGHQRGLSHGHGQACRAGHDGVADGRSVKRVVRDAGAELVSSAGRLGGRRGVWGRAPYGRSPRASRAPSAPLRGWASPALDPRDPDRPGRKGGRTFGPAWRRAAPDDRPPCTAWPVRSHLVDQEIAGLSRSCCRLRVLRRLPHRGGFDAAAGDDVRFVGHVMTP